MKLDARRVRPDEVVHLFWPASAECREAHARVLRVEPDGAWIALDRSSQVERRMVARHAPAEPLRAQATVVRVTSDTPGVVAGLTFTQVFGAAHAVSRLLCDPA